MFCEKCGTRLNDQANFCASCGTPVQMRQEPSDGSVTEGEVTAGVEATAAVEVTAAVEETAAASAAVKMEEPVRPESSAFVDPAVQPAAAPKLELPPLPEAGQPAKAALLKRPWFQATIGAVVVAAAAAAVFFFVPLNGSGQNEPLLIMSENELLLKASSKAEPISVSSEVSDDDELDEFSQEYIRYNPGIIAQLNDDKTKLFFLDRIKEDGTGSLYYREVKAKPSDDSVANKGTKLASGVLFQYGSQFTIANNGKGIIYVKNYTVDEGGKLSYHDLKNETVIDSGVYDYWYSDDQSALYYTKQDDEETILYFVTLQKPEDKTKVDSDIGYISDFDQDTAKIYYTKSDDKPSDTENSSSTMTLYSRELTQDRTKVLDGISFILSGIDNNEFYYTTETRKEVSLASLVDDPLAQSDAAMKEPVYSDYQTVVQVPQTDYWTGETYYYDDIETDYDALYDAYDAYDAKLARDDLRQSLQGETIEDISYNLNLFSNGQSTLIASDYLNSPFNDLSSKLIVYNKNDRGSMNKLSLTDISSAEDVRAAYDETLSESGVTYMSLGAIPDIEFGDEDTASWNYAISADGKQLYVIESTDSKDELVSYDLGTGKPENRQVIDDEAASMTYIADAGQMYYYKDVNDSGAGELYSRKNGTSQKIAFDVQAGQTTIYSDQNVVLYMTDYDEDDETGTLNMYQDQKSTKIANDIGLYFFTYGSDLYYLNNYDSDDGNGDLIKYISEDKNEKIRDDVYGVYPTEFGYSF
ncbi:zinc ribbon domain-containing protein [Cohnella lubricantis]|uniref:Zinc ribbon domain-containing protein n=1 Tax=Cohnella lubricantis TaxID=2163172 RepID=A0A841TFJ5_9BACL|nr:zinc ribbon domain-containing protein [Cohnella lubricantis]MBB6678000.1 zinc ribbon domain-containing protein [Cohnella lubricantis]MBP2118167.1 hypothetical protein [Cohnella lubricantis]